GRSQEDPGKEGAGEESRCEKENRGQEGCAKGLIVDAAIAAAVSALRAGGVVAYPTEAVYGLGCDPHNQAACVRLFTLKQRPLTQGVLLIAADFAQVEKYIDLARVPADALARVRASWPGPHTWVFPRSAETPTWLTGSHTGIALRVTAHTQ